MEFECNVCGKHTNNLNEDGICWECENEATDE